MSWGYSSHEIARQLGLSVPVVADHKVQAMCKLGLARVSTSSTTPRCRTGSARSQRKGWCSRRTTRSGRRSVAAPRTSVQRLWIRTRPVPYVLISSWTDGCSQTRCKRAVEGLHDD